MTPASANPKISLGPQNF